MKIFRKISYLLIIAILLNMVPVTVFGASLKIVSIQNLNVSVKVNQKYSLPKTVKANMSNKTVKDVSITWDKNTINTSKVGTFTYKGTVKNYTPKVTLVLIVVSSNTATPAPTLKPTPTPTSIPEVNQYEKNIQAMLSTYSNKTSYWDYFVDSNRYPYYIYLDKHYSAKSSLPLLQGAESFFRVNIDPSLIVAADVIYNDKALEGQSKERAKKILISMINRSGDDWYNYSLLNSYYETADLLLSNFKFVIENDKKTFADKFDNDYNKLDNAIKNIKADMYSRIRVGQKPTAIMVLESKIVKNLYQQKADLVKKLEDKMKLINSKKLEKIAGRVGFALNAVNFLNVSAEEYQDICNLLQANGEFIEFLTFLEKNSTTTEVKQAAKELREYYQKELEKKTNTLVDSAAKGGIAVIKDFIKGASFQVSFATFAVDTITNVGDKIDCFEKLRLTSSMSVTTENEIKKAIEKYKKPILNSDKEDAVNSIYKYAPYLFAMRLEGEDNLFEYLKVLGADENEIGSNKNSVISGIETIYNTFYKNIRPVVNFSSMKEIVKDKFADLIGIYDGTYTATQGITGLTLEIYKTGSDSVEAKFSFYPVSKNLGVPEGSVIMKVNYKSKSDIVFSAYKWAKRPSNYYFVDLKGQLNSGTLLGDVLKGSDYSNDVGTKTGQFSIKKRTTNDDKLLKVTGIYDGTYTANQGVTGVTIEIYKIGDNEAEAKYSFYPVSQNPNVPKGAILMKVKYNYAEDTYEFDAYKWVNRPSKYNLVNLIGKLYGTDLRGDILTESNSDTGDFNVKKRIDK